MRTLKIKFSAHTESCTLAHPLAPLGHNDDSSVQIVEIVNIPDDVSAARVVSLWSRTVDATWLGKGPGNGRPSFDFSEIGEGVLLRA